MDTIFGYTWEDIQRAQQGGRLSKPIVLSDDIAQYAVSDAMMLEKYGALGLQEMGYDGVIGRLRRSGKI